LCRTESTSGEALLLARLKLVNGNRREFQISNHYIAKTQLIFLTEAIDQINLVNGNKREFQKLT